MRQIHSSAWLLCLFSATLQILIFPLPNLYMLCWIASAALLAGLLRARVPKTLQLNAGVKLLPASPAQGFVLGYVCGIVWYAGSCYWIYPTMRQYGGLNAPAAFGCLILFCLYLALYHGAFGLGVSLLAGESSFSRRALLLSPFLWVAVELARTRISGFPWDLLGITQVDNVALAHVSRFTGVYGVSFEIMVVNAALASAFLLAKLKVPRERWKSLLLACVIAIVILQSGRWISPEVLMGDRSARLVQQNIPVLEGSEWTKEYFDGTLRDLTLLSLNPVGSQSKHADLIVWPESPAPFYSTDPAFRESLSTIARESGAWTLAGSLGIRNASETPERATQVYNSGNLISPQGEWVARYDKIHLVPFGEYVPFKRVFGFAGGLTKEVGDFLPGTSRAPLEAGDTRLGVFICYESIFPYEIRQSVANGAQVLVNISNDGWYGDSGAYAQHLRQARMRAMENARWLLRATNTGVTAVIDPYGRVAASAPRKMRTALEANYALSNVTTFYTRHGDWFAYLCAIISGAALVIRFAIRRKAEN
jgi:apolipoprotein N-acyltransferase